MVIDLAGLLISLFYLKVNGCNLRGSNATKWLIFASLLKGVGRGEEEGGGGGGGGGGWAQFFYGRLVCYE